MGRVAAAQFGFCIDCKAGDHEACVSENCHCRGTSEHKEVLQLSSDDDQVLPEEFMWEDPPEQQRRHPLTAEKQRLLKSQPRKFAHIKHYEGKSSAYQKVRNFNQGRYKDLDRTEWEFRHVKDGVHGPGSDLYAAYIGE